MVCAPGSATSIESSPKAYFLTTDFISSHLGSDAGGYQSVMRALSSGLCGPPLASTTACCTLPITEESCTLGCWSPDRRKASKKVLVWSPSTADTQEDERSSPTACAAMPV